MSLLVTLDVFSGRSNPTWEISEADGEKLMGRIHALTERTATKPPGALGRLGYRGFRIMRTTMAPEGALSVRLHSGVIDVGQMELNYLDRELALERQLLETGGSRIEASLRSYVLQEMETRVSLESLLKGPAPARCPKCVAPDAPPYNAGKWNVPNVQPYNNCYNYANDQITNTFAQPGRAHGRPITALSCNGVQPSAQADGLVPSANFSTPLKPGQGWYVALVIWPNTDYHWYRQDNVGCWSHKPGQTAARNTDNSGNPISDPQNCDRGPYTVFCTYMITNRNVVIR